MLAASLVALGSISAQGHASVTSLPTLQIPVDALHAACAAGWVGGLVIVTIWVFRLPKVAGVDGRTIGGILLARFSALALIAVGLIVLSGVVRAFGQMSSPADLWRTSYGWTILVKIGLLAIAGVLALRSRRIVSRCLPKATGSKCRALVIWSDHSVVRMLRFSPGGTIRSSVCSLF